MDWLAEKARKVKLVLLDVDGVMTDGSITINPGRVETKAFNVKDGHGVKLLKQAGVEVAIISSRASQVVDWRAQELGITLVFQQARDKREAYTTLVKELALEEEEIAYLGDDLVDLPILRRVGLSAAVADAVDEVKKEADYVTSRPGGRGAVRELAEVILKLQGKWELVMEQYLGK